MQKVFQFPDVGEGIAEGEILQWLVSEGDVVKEDQPLVEIETDKAVVSLPSAYSGKILKITGSPGEIILVGAELVTIETEVSSPQSPHEDDVSPKERKDVGSVVGILDTSEAEFLLPESLQPLPLGDKPNIRAIPSVRARAKALGLDLLQLKGSGPCGRITREDVEEAGNSKINPPDLPSSHASESGRCDSVERVPFRGVRRSAARHVSESSRNVAAVTFVDDADITQLEGVRLSKKGGTEERGFKLTYLPFIIKSVVAALKTHPYLNASLDEEKKEILLKKYYNIGIAVDTEEGLMVFVIKRADEKSILDLAEELSVLTEKAFSRTIALSDLKGGTFTLTNYGVIGGIYGTPIINFPEVGILGIGKITDKPVVRSGEIVIRKILPLSLTFDHRVIYGGEAARFMNSVIEHLEDPDLLLIEGK